MSKKINPEIDKHLCLWGAWRRGEVKGLEVLGYPGITPPARLYESPGRGSLQAQVPNYWTDRRAQWVERRLTRVGSRFVNALWCRYVGSLNDDKASKAMGTDVNGYRALLEESVKQAADAMKMRYYVWSGDPERWLVKKA